MGTLFLALGILLAGAVLALLGGRRPALATAAGVGRKLAGPAPSWPLPLSPQPQTDPSLRRASEKWPLGATCVTWSMSTVAALERVLNVPSPTAPVAL